MVGVYPESLRDRLLDPLALAGVERLVSLSGGDLLRIYLGIQSMQAGMPHDGIETLRRNVRWVTNHRAVDDTVPLSIAAD